MESEFKSGACYKKTVTCSFYWFFWQVNNSSIDENAHNSVYQSQKKMEELINGCKEVWRIYF